MSTSDEFDGLGVYGRAVRKALSAAGMDELGPVQGATAQPKRKRPPELLEEAAATFRERNAVYGDNYLRFGHIFRSLFPGGVVPAVATDRDMDRIQLLVQITNKLTRYAESIARGNGGHLDSAHDMIVYAAMLVEVTERG